MANFVCLLTARAAMAGWNVREEGVAPKRLLVYASKETHTWIQKAADLAGLGTNAIRWIDTDAGGRIHFTVAFRWAEVAETGLYRKLGLLSDRKGDYPRRPPREP